MLQHEFTFISHFQNAKVVLCSFKNDKMAGILHFNKKPCRFVSFWATEDCLTILEMGDQAWKHGLQAGHAFPGFTSPGAKQRS